MKKATSPRVFSVPNISIAASICLLAVTCLLQTGCQKNRTHIATASKSGKCPTPASAPKPDFTDICDDPGSGNTPTISGTVISVNTLPIRADTNFSITRYCDNDLTEVTEYGAVYFSEEDPKIDNSKMNLYPSKFGNVELNARVRALPKSFEVFGRTPQHSGRVCYVKIKYPAAIPSPVPPFLLDDLSIYMKETWTGVTCNASGVQRYVTNTLGVGVNVQVETATYDPGQHTNKILFNLPGHNSHLIGCTTTILDKDKKTEYRTEITSIRAQPAS